MVGRYSLSNPVYISQRLDPSPIEAGVSQDYVGLKKKICIRGFLD